MHETMHMGATMTWRFRGRAYGAAQEYLSANGALTQQQAGERHGVTPQAVSDCVRRMQAQGALPDDAVRTCRAARRLRSPAWAAAVQHRLDIIAGLRPYVTSAEILAAQGLAPTKNNIRRLVVSGGGSVEPMCSRVSAETREALVDKMLHPEKSLRSIALTHGRSYHSFWRQAKAVGLNKLTPTKES